MMKTDRQQAGFRLFIGVLATSFLLATGCVTVDTNNVDVRPWNRPSQEWSNWRVAGTCGVLRVGTRRIDPIAWEWIGYCLLDLFFAGCRCLYR